MVNWTLFLRVPGVGQVHFYPRSMMEDLEVMVGVRDIGCGISSSNEEVAQQVTSVRETQNLGIDLLDDLDSYWDDINDRLAISRMVSDSVIRGMVKAVEQAAEDKIAAKELEVECLKEKMRSFPFVADKSKSLLGSSLAYHEMGSKRNGFYCNFSDAFVEHNRRTEYLGGLRNVTKVQIRKLKKEVDSRRGCNPERRNSSGSELVGLDEILPENESESFPGIDKVLETLKMTLDDIYTQVDDMVYLTTASLCEWKLEQEFQKEVEAMVIQSSIRSFREEYEEKFWDHNSPLERINEVSNLKKELDAILNSLSNPANGQLISHGSHSMDNLHRRGLSNHLSFSPSLWEGNGVFDESNNDMPESWDVGQLKHMTKDDLVNYFNSALTKMRRNHESKVQEMTEEFFSLKREYLKEKGSSLSLRKERDLEILRKKIQGVVLKLDGIVVENEKLSSLCHNTETLDSLMNRMDSLLLENHQLRDSLSDQRKEVKYLSLQVSDAAEEMMQHSLAETNLLKVIENLKSDVEDAEIKASATEEVYMCLLREVTHQNACDSEEIEMQSINMREIGEIGDSDIDSLITQGLCGVIFKEAIKDARSNIDYVTRKFVDENENRASLELKALEREEKLRLVIAEKERLQQEVHLLVGSVLEKEKLRAELSVALVKEKEQIQLASEEADNLKDKISWLQNLATERNRQLDLIKGELALVLEQIEVGKGEINKLDRKVELMTKELRETNEHRNELLVITEEKQKDILLLEAKENEQRKQMQDVIGLVRGLSTGLTNLEWQVVERLRKYNIRLEESSSQLSSLVRKSNSLKNTALLYKKRLERRCNDLQMAEAEVDLLGDEVDALLSLLENIYIALDHYSPIFHHYPGVIEILKLVRRELSIESTKSI